MKKVITVIIAAIVTLIAPRWISYYGIAYELRDVPPEKHAFELDVTTVGLKYMIVELLSVPLAAVLLLTAVGLYIFERRKGKAPR